MQSTYGACFLTGSAKIFKKLDNKVLDRIASKSFVHKFNKKKQQTKEFSIEGKVYIVHDGCIFLSYMDENGKKIILDILAKGDIFGDLDFDKSKHPSSENLFIEPFASAAVCELRKSEFREILLENPEFTISLLSKLSSRLTFLEKKVGTIAFSDVEARLLAQMIKIGHEHGKEDDNIINIGLRVTHEKLGEMVGAARETVSETISKLRNKGVLSQDNKRKFILHKDKIGFALE